MADTDPAKTGPTDPEPIEPDELEEVDEPDGGDDPEAQEWTAPTREQWEAQQAALDAEKAKLKRAREQAKRLREGKPAEGAAGDGGQPAAQSGEVDVWKGRAVRAAAKVELINRGADPDMVDLALARLKPAEIEFDTDDEPELDDWLDEMQERYPKLFVKQAAVEPARAQQRAGRIDQGAVAPARVARTKLSLGEQILANSQVATRRRGRP